MDQRIRRLASVVAVAVLTARALTALDPNAPASRDASYYLYFSLATADGSVLYRDYYETKTPLSVLVGGSVVQVADALGVDAVLALRVAYVGFGLLPWALIAVYALLRGGRVAVVSLPLAAVLAWAFLGSIPASGVVPKTLLVLISALMVFAIEAKAWRSCGLLASLGFLDWQVGGLLLPAATLAAWVAREGWRKLAHIGLGFTLGLAAMTAFFALHHAAADLWRTAVVAAATSESSGVLAATLGQRLLRIFDVARQAAHASAAPLGLLHLVALALSAWITVKKRDPVVAFACAYAGAMTAAAFLEMDGTGDLYPYVASGLLALFVGVTRIGSRGSQPARGWSRTDVLVALIVVAVGYGVGAQALARRMPLPFTIEQQRQLAHQLFQRIPPQQVASVGFPELHLLERQTAPGPFIYFSPNAWRYLRRGDEDWRATSSRLFEQADVEAAIIGRSHSPDSDFPFAELADETPSAYTVRTWSLGALCYSLLVRHASALATGLQPGTSCPP